MRLTHISLASGEHSNDYANGIYINVCVCVGDY